MMKKQKLKIRCNEFWPPKEILDGSVFQTEVGLYQSLKYDS